MIRTLSLSALLLAGTPALLAAQTTDDPCPDARTQTEMTVCAGQMYARADTLLNERYQRLVRLLAPEAHRVTALREAQRAWIRYRDAHCDFEGSEFQGGTMQPMIEALCKADLTEQRADEFAKLIQSATER